jgi:hypothetical protein
MFKITDSKGFHITFDNGYTVSVQFGAGNYCDNYGNGKYREPANPSATAEVAAWDANEEWVSLVDGSTEIKGYQTPAQVLEILNHIAAL